MFACCILHKFCQLKNEASLEGGPNINVDLYVGLIRQRHLHREGREVALAKVALKNALFTDFFQN